MYNGIGLNTPRGSGTNGYVVRNLSFVRPPPTDRRRDEPLDLKAPVPGPRQPNKDILQHDRKRAVELKCMELRITLEDDGVDEDEIENQVSRLREKLADQIDEIQPRDAKKLQDYETHQRSEAKERENQKMRNALRVSSTYVEGQAFDRELQEQRRLERLAQREEQEARRLENERKRRRRDRSEDKRHSTSRRTRRRSRSPYSSEEEEEERYRRRERRSRRRSPSPSSSERSASSDSRSSRSSSSVSSRGRDRRSYRSRGRRSPSRSVSVSSRSARGSRGRSRGRSRSRSRSVSSSRSSRSD
ncbi:hypothetical protein BCR43DRAFT_464467 [Syncephalastrum racemosum]|uniref:CWF21 domain-containing protein n=1 Tax=Syncephalastrum racemosum TaxID=13706 RepID=A0A1X2H0C0_SYNRA|nr:hypothetical protein BCR43DRAFT_464467 [Syncephalastrum racemosum]